MLKRCRDIDREAASPGTGSGRDTLADAVFATVAYREIFDYPLRRDEIKRYLIGTDGDGAAVDAAIDGLLGGALEESGGLVMLAGRADTAEMRRRREQRAGPLWQQARRYAAVLASLPFVRMVAVTGSLAANNPSGAPDIDFMIVTRAGCLWRVRTLCILMRLCDHRFGKALLCPNYFVSEKALTLRDRRLYVAQELAQMVPLFGPGVYRNLRRANRWADDYLPNAGGPPFPVDAVATRWPRLKTGAERVLDTAPGRWFESWESRRKILRYRSRRSDPARWSPFRREATGHQRQMGDRIEKALAARLAEFGVQFDVS